eukprot:scaffold29517_cov17-Tisochrysis_lutea.AAC.2
MPEMRKHGKPITRGLRKRGLHTMLVAVPAQGQLGSSKHLGSACNQTKPNYHVNVSRKRKECVPRPRVLLLQIRLAHRLETGQ